MSKYNDDNFRRIRDEDPNAFQKVPGGRDVDEMLLRSVRARSRARLPGNLVFGKEFTPQRSRARWPCSQRRAMHVSEETKIKKESGVSGFSSKQARECYVGGEKGNGTQVRITRVKPHSGPHDVFL